MDATRAEVERELKRMLNCVDSARKEVEQQRNTILNAVVGEFSSVDVMNGADWLRSKEENVRLYHYAGRILRAILDRTQPPAVEGE